MNWSAIVDDSIAFLKPQSEIIWLSQLLGKSAFPNWLVSGCWLLQGDNGHNEGVVIVLITSRLPQSPVICMKCRFVRQHLTFMLCAVMQLKSKAYTVVNVVPWKWTFIISGLCCIFQSFTRTWQVVCKCLHFTVTWRFLVQHHIPLCDQFHASKHSPTIRRVTDQLLILFN